MYMPVRSGYRQRINFGNGLEFAEKNSIPSCSWDGMRGILGHTPDVVMSIGV
jgi:hypothetical protein